MVTGLGLHMAIDESELIALMSTPEGKRADFATELEERKSGTRSAYATDKAWVFLHEALNDCDPFGSYALPGGLVEMDRYAIIGGEDLEQADDYYIGLLRSEFVGPVADTLDRYTDADIARRVMATHERLGLSNGAQDAAYAAENWPGFTAFYRNARDAGDHVIFTVDQ